MRGPRDRKDALLEAGLTLASELSLPIVLQRIVDLAAQVTDARYGALGVIGEGDTLVEFVTTGISADQRQAIGSLPSGRGVLGLLIHEPRPVRINNIADHPQSVGFPAHHPPMHSFLGAPVQAMGRIFGNIYLAEKREAAEFSEEDEQSLTILATQAGVAIANATLYEEVRSREGWLDALREVTTHVLEGDDEASLLEMIAERAGEIAGADAATIVTTSDSPEKGVVATVIRDGPAAYVPLRLRGGPAWRLMLTRSKGSPTFDERRMRLVETFADQAAVAIDYGRAQTDLRRLELMDERERIAKELHDGIIQSLFAVGMGLQGTALITGSQEVSTRIEKAVDELDRVIRDLRNYIFGLRPGILADRQLDQALRALGADTESRSQTSVAVEIDAGVAAILSARSVEIVQLTREALSNVIRHARATQATVRLTRHGNDAVLSIEDNGIGFAPRKQAAGLGIGNMRARATNLGGELEMNSRVNGGTQLRVVFPLEGATV